MLVFYNTVLCIVYTYLGSTAYQVLSTSQSGTIGKNTLYSVHTNHLLSFINTVPTGTHRHTRSIIIPKVSKVALRLPS